MVSPRLGAATSDDGSPSTRSSRFRYLMNVRSADSFKVRDPAGAETTVLLTSSTKVTSHGMGKKGYEITYIMKGLRLQAQGKGDSDGNLVADWVRFDEQDLRSAQALEQTDKLTLDNQKRIDEQIRLDTQEYEAMRAQAGESPGRKKLRDLGHLP